DPHVWYDRLSQRWFVVMINASPNMATPYAPNRVMLAVSSGPTITNTSSFTFFQWEHDLVGTTPNVDTGNFLDFPTLGVDQNALSIGGIIFDSGGNSVGTTVFVVRKAALLTGSAVVTVFRGVSNNATEGPYVAVGVSNDDAAATEGYFIGSDNMFY